MSARESHARRANIDEGFVRRSSADAPSWTDTNAHDPGITLLAVFAFVATGLLYGARRRDDRLHAGGTALGVGAAGAVLATCYVAARAASRRRGAPR